MYNWNEKYFVYCLKYVKSFWKTNTWAGKEGTEPTIFQLEVDHATALLYEV